MTSSHPEWRYLVAFDRESAERPTDAEAALLVSYLDDYKTYWYNASYLAHLSRRPLDVDGGANGVVFHKYGADDWGYRRQSWERGPLFVPQSPANREWERGRGYAVPGPLSLAGLMDFIHQHGSDEPNKRWEAWKAAHPEVFGKVG